MTSRPVGKPNTAETAANSTPTTVSSARRRACAASGTDCHGDDRPRGHLPADVIPHSLPDERKALDVPR